MDPDLAAEKLRDLTERSARQRKRHYARQPRRAADVVAQLLARKGYGATETDERLRRAWAEAAGPALARASRPVGVRRGRLEVLVASSMMMQELGFERRRLLEAMQRALGEARIEELKFRVGRIN